ncbi:hypothetical protein RFI_15844 [Reticulomyxa filosa]|uniref:Uncharacterized protein n=1 Tax=Reticulomyxa filosa TaxID=46433 RepID=X6N504_RETFI|nr:hypothetical protein RFI_15844 [Reticulomyxa filosa]|eukprot:ETO21360.1 hypothetical protein RFI_15844 [Reticulomyxa filosa]
MKPRDSKTRERQEHDRLVAERCTWKVPLTHLITTSRLDGNYKKSKKVNDYYKQVIKEKINFNYEDDNVCKTANDFVQELIEASQYEERCAFRRVYGVVLGGSLQKRLAIQHKFDGDIIFLFHLKKKIKKTSAKELAKDQRSNFRIISNHKRNLGIEYEGYEYDILVAFTYEVRLYCCFHYKANKQHVYLLNNNELKIAASDLLHHYKQYKDAIDIVQNTNVHSSDDIDFLHCNMSAALTILSTYYVRESFIGTETRLAILVLKAWKQYLVRRHPHILIKSISIEMLCVYAKYLIARNRKKKRASQNSDYSDSDGKEDNEDDNDNEIEITLLDIIQQCLLLLIYIGEQTRIPRSCTLMWPYQKNQSLLWSRALISTNGCTNKTQPL